MKLLMVAKKLNMGKIFKNLDLSLMMTYLLNRVLKFYNITINIRSVFSDYNKFYPQLFLDDALYEL